MIFVPSGSTNLSLVLLTINRQSCTITEKAPTSAFSWLNADYAKQVLTPQKVDVKLGHQRKSHKGRAGWLAWCHRLAFPL